MSGKHATRKKNSQDHPASLQQTPIAAGLMRFGRLAGVLGFAGSASFHILMAADVLLCTRAWAQTVPRVAATALPNAPSPEKGSRPINYAVNGNKATITQTAPTSIVNWKSFDIGSAASVNVVQPSSTSVLLNKVAGGAFMNQTTIDGVLNANGRVYIYNPNGIVFGKTAQVNVNTLVASSLKFDESRVIGGFLQPGPLPLLGADPAYAGGVPGAVQVDGDGSSRAALTAANGGLILLAGPRVVNNGALSAPDGQVMLAAGSKVYLAAPDSATGTSLRGLLVEVSNNYAAGSAGPAASIGASLAENGQTGSIDVGRGNATMIGYAVNQKGIVSASTSVTLNGSIYLYARDQAIQPDATKPYHASRTGTLVLGENSVTQILPTLDDKATIPVTRALEKSDVQLNGANIELGQNASILAPGGNVTIKAERLAANTVIDPKIDIVRVDFAPGSSVDVSGSSGAQLAMESNVMTVDLRGTELADNVVLRNSPLYGTKVQIDVRKGTPAANVSGWLNLVEHTLAELNTAGGTVNVSADGAIIQRPGSKINVDGGWVDYLPGYVNTTKLQFNDKLVDIGSAATNTLYSAAVNQPNGPDNYEAGYRQGSSAGTVKFSAPILVLQGDLSGQATAGVHQRDVSKVDFPLGGQLQVGSVTPDLVDPTTGKAKTSLADQFGFAGKLVIGGSGTAGALAPAVGAAFDVNNLDQRLLASTLDLDPEALARAGFNRLVALTSGNIEVAAPVSFAPGGKLWLGAGQSTVANADGTVSAGGNVSFKSSVSIPGGSVTAAASGILQVADGVAFDLAGRWTNDREVASPATDASGMPTGRMALNGGSLNLSASQLNIGNAVADVSAGAWLDASGKTTRGSAGSITFTANPIDSGVPSAASLQLGSGLRLSGYGFGSGGKLKLVGRNVTVGQASTGADPADLSLAPAFFQHGGFTSYDIGANLNFTVLANTLVQPRAKSLQFKPNFGKKASGSMSAVAAPRLFSVNPPGSLRPVTSVTFRAPQELLDDAGRLLVDDGAQVVMDPGASLNLLAGRQLTENGILNAPGGHIVLGLTTNAGVTPFRAERSIWFGSKAQVLASGSAQRLHVSADGIASGDVLDGGTIQVGNMQNGVLTASDGYVVAASGAQFNVSGVYAGKLRMQSAMGVAPVQDVASAGGSIEIRAREGLLFAGTLAGAGGGANASGGSLTVALDTENQGGNTYPGDQRILTISAKSPARGIVPAGLKPDQPIVVDQVGTGADAGTDLGWFLTGSKPGPNARHTGQGWLQAASFASGGFGRLDFKSQDVLSFGLGSSNLALSAGDSLVLDAPTLLADNNPLKTTGAVAGGHTLTLSAPYIQLGSSDLRYQTPGASSTGSAQLKANASTIDLIGNSALQGFGDASLAAKADIRLVGMPATDASGNSTGYALGSFAMAGNLTLTDAQTYPTTLSDFTLAVAPNGTDLKSGTLTFASNGNSAQQVLSAGGSLTGIASHIVQAGRVVAPFGAITFGNVDSSSQPIVTTDVEYRQGSVTSVAGAGVVPFGTVANGSVATASDWQYSLSDGTSISFVQNPAAGGSQLQRALPAKTITSHARTISADSGALLDLSGGGSLYAYEFTPGKGGSQDVLSNNKPGSKTTVFAINPNFSGSVAPIDGLYGSDGGLAPGDSVYLSGMAGLAGGAYTLLPAHYALLPGGYSITVASNTRDMQPASNITLQDGSMLISGHLAEAGSGSGNARSSGFVVSSGSVIRSKSEFAAFDATSYFNGKASAAGIAAPELPVDGGRLAFDATGAASTSLALDSTVQLGAGAGGRRGQADISAAQIEIVSDRSQGTGNAVKLVAGDLTAMGADSLLLGALRDARSDGLHLNVGATAVTLNNDAQHPLSGSEIVIAASDTVKVDPGAVIQSEGTLGRASQDIALTGNGALLRVSSGAPVSVVRNAAAGSGGTLDIASGASVGSAGSAYLDASGKFMLNGQLNLAPGSALGIGAPGINLGSGIPAAASVSMLQLGADQLAKLSLLSQLAFNSYSSTINLYGTVNLGSAAMRSLSFKGIGFQGFDGAADASPRQAMFVADSVRFDGQAAIAAPSPSASASGTLAVQANEIDIGNNAFAIHGYADTMLTARSQALAVGSGGLLSVDQNMTLAAGRIGTTSGADATFKAGGNVTLSQLAGAAVPATAPALGGRLGFEGASIVSDALIQAPSGQVLLSGANGVDISGGRINTAGVAVSFGSTTAYASGGRIELDGGNVVVASQAVLDVSAVGAAAGTLSISASKPDGSGFAQLDGALKGGAVAGVDGVQPTQGQFVLNTDQAGANGWFGALNSKLNGAGFTESRQFRFTQGDVALGGTDKVNAHQFILAADNGNIAIGDGATIDASGSKGGSIELYASQAAAGGNAGKVRLSGTASLLANATAAADSDAGSSGNGGRVVIGTSSADGLPALAVNGGGSISLDGGTIDVAGSSTARNGTVTLRAPRIGSGGGNDVAIGSLNTDIRNSADTVIEAYKVYTGSRISEAADSATNLDATAGGRMYTEANSFIGNKANILSRLVNPNLSLHSGIEVRAPAGDLTVSVNEFAANAADRGWNLDAWRFGGAPVTLTLRAQRNLNILGSISDGFIKPASGPALGMPDWQLGTGASASYRLAGGANLAAANPLAVNSGAGDVVFGFADRTPTSTAPLSATDAPVALVRSGTGRIDVAAGRDVNLQMAKFFTNADGTPVIYDAANIDGSFKVSVYGASVYTAGQAASLPDPTVFTAPQNALNTHYGAAANALSSATFSSGGGAITLYAGRDVNGPHNLGSDWFYLNADGQAAVPADPTTTPATPAVPAVPATKVMLPKAGSQLVNNWLFRQGRSYVDANGNTVFEKLDKGSTLNTAWWSRFDYFDQGVATLGGGDVSVIAAAGKVVDLSASVATNAYVSGPIAATLKEQGGGDLLVRAGGDILGGAFYVQKGNASLHADGSVGAGNYLPAGAAGPTPLNPVLAVGDAQFDVSAGHNLVIETSYNPMLTEQSVNNVRAGDGAFGPKYGVGGGGARWDVADQTPDSLVYRKKYAQFSNFSTYGTDSAVHLTAVGGNLLLSNDSASLALAGGSDIPNNLGTTFPSLYLLEPAKLSAAALSGDLTSSNGFMLMPASRGQLDLLAAGTIGLSNGASGSSIRMLDNDPNAMSSTGAPRVFTQTDLDVLAGTAGGISAHVLGGLHTGDAQPVRIIALSGDIIGDGSAPTTISLPKEAQIIAGRDIRDLGFSIQHNDASDVSSVAAGRDFIDTTQSRGSGESSLVSNIVTGPGRIDLSAGRNVDFGNGSGLVTTGNFENPYLAEGGAAINVVAGAAQADYASYVRFASKYGSISDVFALTSTLTTSTLTTSMLTASEQRDLIAYVRSTASTDQGLSDTLTAAAALELFRHLSSADQRPFLDSHQSLTDIPALVAFVRNRLPDLPADISAVDAWASFRGLPEADQSQFLATHQAIANSLASSAMLLANAKSKQDYPLLNDLFFSSLVDDSQATKLAAFDARIASLFPTAAAAQGGGDIAVFASQLKTEQGGSIDLFAPTGSVYAGLTIGVAASQASTQGIFTLSGGEIRSLVKKDFLVNQGRVFTEAGGDITLVSQYGDIDAGRGAKTASSAPPPRITVDRNGNVRLDPSSSISGSGIATFKTRPNQRTSTVYPIAPRGIFNAGDAGVRSSGSVKIVAHVVLNGDNISAGGTIAGASTVVQAPSIGSVAAPSNAAPRSDDVAKSLSNADPAAAAASLAVEVLGYGEDDEQDANAPDDAASDTSDDDAKKKKAAKAKKKS